ncbi:MAG: MarR family winged helix-turn-helix transcriptional regulator [Roseovarius sp.]|nr:MarR family winged helix-turn-helix transcriptional regulator [Roseovarius sp.]
MGIFKYDLNRHLTYRIARLQARLNAQATELLKAHAGISLAEWRILAILSNPEIETQKDVLVAMGLDKGQISRTVKKLEQKMLVAPASSAAKPRNRPIILTDSGKAILKTMFPIMTRRQALLQSDLSDDEIATLFELLTRIERKSGHVNISLEGDSSND